MLSPNAIRVLEKRYLRKDSQGMPIETPEEMFWRVAKGVAEPDADLPFEGRNDPDATARTFHEILSSLEFLPNSPTLMNAGRETSQLSACFVLPVEDSMEGIFDALKYTAVIHKTGGGTGFSFSRLRPKNSPVRSTNGIASGPVSFMKVFNAATEAVKQGGARRGANMGILRVDHPDILEFIRCKRDLREVTNFNISVAVTDAFMKAVIAGTDYDLLNPLSGLRAGSLGARKVFEEIVDGAWRCGDPGVVFIDRINDSNPTRHVAEIEATNPCGEQPLMPNESCNLGSINLGLMANEDGIDWERLARVTRIAVHFLDNVIEANRYPVAEIGRVTKENRRIGVGVMGWADLLIRLGIPYDSQAAVDLGGRLMAFIDMESKSASAALAAERGVFPNWHGSSYDVPEGQRLRNATTTTVAPTGTISIIAGASSGIEPIFAVSFARRNVLDDDELLEAHPRFEQIARERGFWTPSLMKKVAEQGGIQHVDGIPADVKRIFVTAHDISPYWHVRMQAAFQAHVDNGVSKTVNFPGTAALDDVREVFLLAYRLGCKGVTVFRDGCRDKQVLHVGAGPSAAVATTAAGYSDAAIPVPSVLIQKIAPRPRPAETSGSTRRVKTGCGNLYVTINSDEKGPFELFTSMGKSGGCASAQSEAISRLASMALRAGVDMESITKQLRGIRCHLPVYESGGQVLSCPDAIGIALQHAQRRLAQESLEAGRGDPGFSALRVAPDSLNPKDAPVPRNGSQRTTDGGPNRPKPASLGAAALGDSFDEPSVHPMAMMPERPDLTRSAGGLSCPDCGGSLATESGCLTCYFCGFSRCD
jgi:ribonucleoside-diphosphate reductase alpha chain